MTGIEQALWVGAPKESATTLVVALHGRGSDETAWADAGTWLPDGVAVAALRGPIALDVGYTWFQNRGIGRPIAESIQATNAAILQWLDDNAASFANVVILGFSGGTAMAGGVVVSAPERFRAAVLISGTLPWDAGYGFADGALTGLPVFWSIDPDDAMIPRDLVERSEAWLREHSGAALTEGAYPGIGHAMNAAQAADIAMFIRTHAG